MSIESVTSSDHLVLCHPLLLLPLIFRSIRVFSNELTFCRWPKYWSFSISPSNEYSGLISFRMDWLGLLSVQGTLKSLLQHHSSRPSVLHVRWPNDWSFSFSITPSNEHSGLISLLSKGLSRVFSNTTVQKHQFFSTQLSLWPN